MKLFSTKTFFSIVIFIFFSSCAYEKMNSTEQKRINIIEIDIQGDRKAAFLIKKGINRFSNKNSNNKMKISVSLNKSKEIEEKNIQNKVTKYRLSLSAQVVYKNLNSSEDLKRTYNAQEIYIVENRYSGTINNFKAAEDAIVDTILNEILDELKIFK